MELIQLGKRKDRHSFNTMLNKATTDAMKTADAGFCCIGITDSCFFKCRMCDKWKEDLKVSKDTRYPDADDWKRFIYQLSRQVSHKLKGNIDERFEINFAGGESLSHPLTLKLVEYAHSLGFRTAIPSNGYLINDNMARRLHEAGLTGINLSLDSLDPKIHDDFRGFKGAHKGVMRAIEALSKYKYPRVGIISIIHGQTYEGIPRMVQWIMQNPDVEWSTIMAIMQPNNTIFESGWYEKEDFNYLWPKDIDKVIKVIDYLIEMKKASSLNDKRGIIHHDKMANTLPQLKAFRNYFDSPEKFVKNDMPCNFDTAVQVSATGDVYMCYHYGKLGNVKDDDFGEIWNSGHSGSIREKIRVCRTNCHELINCYYKEEYPFKVLQ